MMRRILLVSVFLLISLNMGGCASDGDSTSSELGTSSSALSAEEQDALDECLEEVRSCRLSDTPDSPECREVYACVPDRPVVEGEGEEDARQFCEAVEERCSQSEMDEESCDALMERCMSDRITPEESGGASENMERPQVTAEECLEDCIASGGDEAGCTQRCSAID